MRSRYDARKLQWFRDGKRFVLLLLVAVLLFRFVIGLSVVSGVSMLDTLHDGDVVVYTRINGPIRRGDIVSLSLPSGEYYVKRVVALPGDTVDLRDGILYINGVAEQGSYMHGETLPEDSAFTYPLTLEEDNVFTVGDNREESIDSRFYGPVRLRQIKGVLRLQIANFTLKWL